MIKRIKKLTVFQILSDSIKDFTSGESMGLAAGTAFYTIFSLPALLIIILNIGGTFYAESEVKDELLVQVEELGGEESRITLEEILKNFSMEDRGVIPNTIAIFILAFSATTVFVSLQNAINHIWHIKPKPEKGILKFIINRLLSFSLVASIGFILIISLILDAALVVINQYIKDYLVDLNLNTVAIVHYAITQAVLVVIFALMYKILPDARVRWRDTWMGAIINMLLFALGKYLIGLYLGNSDIGSAYGAAGSLAILLVWVYYSVVIFLFGAQITYYIAEKVGGNIIPLPQAVKVELREIES
ncbi:YihY/virulence factor BrkB family protein [Cecembia lonarensis]|uniref:YihY family inner membrane protein n=1 Tax=Cecembia lonarensis (strain CCUG 58316 / KCTC 22772 / LW9) TaxID=1225176 RepID=K1L896_CECL9|nr:YihY/virulence factor BrkB family protein [Cecembia lonarensis]EKB50926.1 ribonuclease BN/unknown domain fusion protein [Cecembia lonarensis LW9]